MRRLILTVLGIAAMIALPASTASAGGQHVHMPRGATPTCGPQKGPTPPPKCKLKLNVTLTPSCQKPGNTYIIRRIHVLATGGLHKIIIKVDGKTVKTFTYNRGGHVKALRGPKRKTLNNVKIHSPKFKHAGRVRLKVTVVDWARGKKKSATGLSALICKPKPPPFTG